VCGRRAQGVERLRPARVGVPTALAALTALRPLGGTLRRTRALKAASETADTPPMRTPIVLVVPPELVDHARNAVVALAAGR